VAKKWKLEGTITFYAHDFVSDAKDEVGALEDLLAAGLFDNAVCGIRFNEENCGCEEAECEYEDAAEDQGGAAAEEPGCDGDAAHGRAGVEADTVRAEG